MTAEHVDAYLADLSEALTALRELTLETVPGVDESMQYRMPTYNLAGQSVCAMASQKRYMSL